MPLTVHFLNVGAGDCTIIEFPSGRIGVVDVHNVACLDTDTKNELLAEYHASLEYWFASGDPVRAAALDRAFLRKAEQELTDPVVYYKQHIGQYKDIFRFLVTHPDMDHMTGLHRIHVEEPYIDIQNFWHTGAHDFNLADTTDEEWASSPYDQRDWETYKTLRDGSQPKSLQKYQGDTGDFWTEDGLHLWAPTAATEQEALDKDQPNILSMVLKITYQGKAIVLGGDATADETWPMIHKQVDMSDVWVLKASHHGRKSGYYGPAVRDMAPWLTITSVGESEHDATQNYRRYSNYTVSLRRAHDIKISIQDDGTLIYPSHIPDYWKPKLED